MKRFLFPFIMLTWIAIWAITPLSHMVGQTEAEPATDLLIQNVQKPKRKVTVESGRKVKVILKDERTYKGVLKSAGESSIKVDSLDFNYNDISILRVPGYGSMGAKVSGGIVALVGFIGFLIGLFMLLAGVSAENNGSNQDCGTAFGIILLIIFGVIIGLMGAALLIAGMIAFMIGVLVGKAFKLDGKWKLGPGSGSKS